MDIRKRINPQLMNQIKKRMMAKNVKVVLQTQKQKQKQKQKSLNLQILRFPGKIQ